MYLQRIPGTYAGIHPSLCRDTGGLVVSQGCSNILPDLAHIFTWTKIRHCFCGTESYVNHTVYSTYNLTVIFILRFIIARLALTHTNLVQQLPNQYIVQLHKPTWDHDNLRLHTRRNCIFTQGSVAYRIQYHILSDLGHLALIFHF